MIKKVTFKLYETYKNPLRCESDSGRKAGRLVPPGKLTATPLLPVTAIEQPPFEVTETGWGEFDIIIKVFFAPESNEKPLTFTHHLKLHPWPVDPILYAQPTATGEPSIPTPSDPAAAATPLAPPVLSPVHSWQYEELCFTEPTEAFYAVLLEHKPTPLPKSNRHPKLLTHPLSAGGNIGEFSLEMEDDEGRRIDKAREKTLEQIEDLRRQLVSYDQELGSASLPCRISSSVLTLPERIRLEEGSRGDPEAKSGRRDRDARSSSSVARPLIAASLSLFA